MTASPNSQHDDQWRKVFESSEAGLRNFLAAKLPQQADVDDCLQTVLVAMLENTKEVPESARKAWLFRVASNEAALYWRKQKTTQRVLETHAQHQVDSKADADSVEVETRETVHQIEAAIGDLPKAAQVIIRMRLNENRTFQQIADELKLPLGTVLTRMRRAMERLRSQFEEE